MCKYPFVNDDAAYVRVLLACGEAYRGGPCINKCAVTLLQPPVYVQVGNNTVEARKGTDGKLYISDTQEQWLYN